MKVTGIGSTPFQNFNQAIEFSKKCDLPFFPEPKNYFLQPEIESIKHFLNQLHDAPELKMQFIGPNTFLKYHDSTIKNYNLKFNSLLNILKAQNKKIYLQLDEPILPAISELKTLDHFLTQINEASLIPLLHTCAKIPDERYFDLLSVGQLAIDINLNPAFINHPKLLISGIDPKIKNQNIKSEYISYTCGYGLLDEKTCLEIDRELKIYK